MGTLFAAGAVTAALVAGAVTDRPSDGPGSVPQVALSNTCNLSYVEVSNVAAPRDFEECTPTGGGGGLEVSDGKEKVPALLRGSVVNCDCANTDAPNIGNAAVHQCLKQERNLMSEAGQGDLVFEVVDNKLTSGDFCDGVTAGAAAWPVQDGSTQPPNPGPDPPPCTDPPDENARCLPPG